MSFHKNLINDDIHALSAKTYADITARDADTAYQVSANLNKMVRIDSPASYYILSGVGPAVWTELSSTGFDTFVELSDTPSSYMGQGNLVVQVNAAGTALEFGQGLTPTSDPTFNDLTVSNLIVNGTTTTINSTTLTVDDKNIELGSVGSPTDITADGGGITLKGATDKTIIWVNSTDAWTFNQNVDVAGDIIVSGTVDGIDIATDVGANTIHRTSDGKNHADVVLNNTHRVSDGSDHTFVDQAVTIASSPTFAGLTANGLNIPVDVAANTTHRSSDGKDHADVVLNNTHRVSDGKDHADVVLNNAHRVSDGKNHADVVLNNAHRVSDGKDHSDVVLNNAHRVSDGKNHADVVLNNTHRTSDGSDHTFIDQSVIVAASPQFAGLAVGGAADVSALVTITSTTKGLLLPRMTEAQRDLINAGNPATGLTIYNTTSNEVEFYNGVGWTTGEGAGDIVGPAGATDNAIARFDGATGLIVQDSGVIIDDSNNVSGIGSLNIVGSLSVALTGTVSVTISTAAVTGTGTAFLTELEVGSAIEIDGEIFTVSAIASDTALTLDSNHAAGASGVTANTDASLLQILTGDSQSALLVTASGNLTISGVIVGGSDTNGNTPLGDGALDALTSGSSNVGIGLDALGQITTGTDNTAVGLEALAVSITGAGNVAVGRGALQNSTGSLNTSVGFESQKLVDSAIQNVSVGWQAMGASTGSGNTAVGYNSLAAAGLGSNNVALGKSSMVANTGGSENVAVGSRALFTNATGSNNVAIGRTALTVSTGDDNTALGKDAGILITTGANNLCLGKGADTSGPTASNEIVLGNSLNTSTILRGAVSGLSSLDIVGSLSVALTGTVTVTISTAAVTGTGTAFLTELEVGSAIEIDGEIFTVSAIASDTALTLDSNHAAGASGVTAFTDAPLLQIINGDLKTALLLSTGGNLTLPGVIIGGSDENGNVSLGDNVLVNLTTANNNTGVGHNALATLSSSGNNNTALGEGALESLTTGANNTGVGRQTLNNIQTTLENTALGNECLRFTTGSGSTAIGSFAMRDATTGNNNVAMGRAALRRVTGNSNVAIGFNVLDELEGGQQNVAIGQEALTDSITGADSVAIGYKALFISTGDDNVAIGSEAGNLITTGAGNICLGKDTNPPNPTDSNHVVLGPASITTTLLRGNVGIGTETPTAQSDIVGNLSVALTGTVSVTISTAAVTGTGTAFLTELVVGSPIEIDGEIFIVLTIASDTALTLDSNHAAGASAVTAFTDPTLFSVINGDAKPRMSVTGDRVFIESDFRSNIGLGTGTLDANTSGSNNTAVGFDSLRNSTGDALTGIGFNALKANVAGLRNTGVGYQALSLNVNAADSTALGYEALKLSIGELNTAIGANALAANTSGRRGTAVGAYALNLSSADDNTGLGFESLSRNAGGISNTAVGSFSMRLITDGNRNTAVGEFALGATTSDADDNTAIGASALLESTGADNTALGSDAGIAITSGTNNIVIGKGADTSGPTVDNEIVIGNSSNTSTLLRGIVTGDQFNPTDELNVVNVYVAADLPDTLVAGTKYVLRAPITVSTTKTFPGTGTCEISSNNLHTNTLTYSGTGNLFEGTSIEGILLNVHINSSSTGTLFSVTGSGSSAFLDIDSGGFDGWDNLGTITSFGSVDMNFITVSNFDSGLTLNSVDGYFSTQSHFFNASDQSTDYLTFDANILDISITNVSFVPIGDERIFNINSSAAVNAFIDDITGVTAANLYFNTAGLVKTSPGIIISNASNIADSTTSAELNLSGNTATTDIPAVNALVEINLNANWVSEEVERLVVGTDGAVESIGLRNLEIKIDATISLEPVTATKDLSCRLVLVQPPPITVTFTNGTNLINETSTALVDGDTISFRDTAGTLPAELRTDIVYYVVSQLTNSFQVSYISGGAAITFTDDGTPTNSYKIAELHGSTPLNTIAAGTPRDLILQSMIPATLGSDSFIIVSNKTDAVDIDVNSGYQRYFA